MKRYSMKFCFFVLTKGSHRLLCVALHAGISEAVWPLVSDGLKFVK
jgi:hypothetical protein